MDATPVTKPIAPPQLTARRLIGAIGLALALSYLIALAGTYLQGHFLVDGQGRPIANDFVDVYAAGQLALNGKAASAYDWTLHRAAEVRALGHEFPNYYGWPYPPTFLFVAAGVAMLPYLAALLVWLATSLAACAAMLRYILGDKIGILLALGFPAALWNISAGQNGFLTATLIGGTLAFLRQRPVLAGIFLGLLTYKPQFGLLFPLVLIVDRRWRTLTVAALVAMVLAATAWLSFGTTPWVAFFHSLPATGHLVLGQGAGDFNRLQSLFGLLRAQGGSEALAWSVQATGSIAVAAGIIWLWRSRAPFDLKAAALASAVFLVTPYVYMYDLSALAVAVAFLLRFALERGFTASEPLGLAAGGMLILIYPYVKTQTGLAAVLIVLALAVQRALVELRFTPSVHRPA